MHCPKWKGANPNSWVRVAAALCATPPTPVAPFSGTYISFWYWHHFLMPKASRELQRRSRTATTVGQGKRLALVFLPPPVRDTQSSPVSSERTEIQPCCLWLAAPCSAQRWCQCSPSSPGWGSQTPSIAALIYGIAQFCSEWVCELISATHWFAWQGYLGTTQKDLIQNPLPFSASLWASLWEAECHSADGHMSTLLPNGWFFTPLVPDPAKMSGQGLSCLLRCLQHGIPVPFQLPLPTAVLGLPSPSPFCTATLGVLTEDPSGPGYREEGEMSTVFPQLPEGAAVAGCQRFPWVMCLSVTSRCAGITPLCKAGHSGVPPGWVLPTVAPALWPDHHAA